MRYEFIAAHEGEHGVRRMCQVLEVASSGYYAWRHRPESRRRQANRRLLASIQAIHRESGESYGSLRVHAALQRQGVACGRHRVARLMRSDGLAGRKVHKRQPYTTQRDLRAIPAPNLLQQDFSAPAPDRKWVSDITYIPTAEGWLFLAAVLDLYSRRVVGWAMDERMQASLPQAAWNMAVLQRRPAPGLLHHSDQGSQYTSEPYQHSLADWHCRVSMSRVGNCYDNAVMESFFSTLKSECVRGAFATRTQARTAIFQWIEAWYNPTRLHSSLGYLSPVEFELKSRD